MKRVIKNKNILHTAACLIIFGLLVLLLTFADEVKRNFGSRLSLCVNTLLPSIFPMLIAASFLTQIGLPSGVEKLWDRTIGKICGFPENSAAAAVFGMLAGYPAGVKSTAILYDRKVISKNEAICLCFSCVHPGISFSVLAVGQGFFHSRALGFTFYLSVLFADLLLARCAGSIYKSDKNAAVLPAGPMAAPLTNALLSAVEGGIRSMLEISAWVLLFSVPEALVQALSPRLSSLLVPFAEVTTAALSAAKRQAPVLCAFSLGFGGVCIHLQLSKDVHRIGVPAGMFLLSRLVAGGLSALFTYAGIRLFPQILPAALQNKPQIIFFRTDPAGFLSLCVVCILFIAEIAEFDFPTTFRGKIKKKHLQ